MLLLATQYYHQLVSWRIRSHENLFGVCQSAISLDVEIATKKTVITAYQEASRIDHATTVNVVMMPERTEFTEEIEKN